jgi:hypothetical protein
MVYIEDIKTYALAIVATIIVIFFAVFVYKWYTKPNVNSLCGDFNNNYCASGKCGYYTNYESGKVGYCRNKILGL